MTYRELYVKAAKQLAKSEITLGEYEEMTKPLDEEIRKVGKWIYTPTKRLVDETDEGAIYDTQLKCNCSVCGADFGYRKMEDKYCKFCGSEMVGTENG